MQLTMFYHCVDAMKSDKCVMNNCNPGVNVATSVNSSLGTDVEVPESRSRESCVWK